MKILKNKRKNIQALKQTETLFSRWMKPHSQPTQWQPKYLYSFFNLTNAPMVTMKQSKLIIHLQRNNWEKD
uniref:Uncharacterized protein n=1 Tax=Daphnia magna TaxID=35525 RepID=A0A0P6BRI5_9CRUS